MRNESLGENIFNAAQFIIFNWVPANEKTIIRNWIIAVRVVDYFDHQFQIVGVGCHGFLRVPR